MIAMVSGRDNTMPQTPPPADTFPYAKIGIYGWRKRCLYMLVLVMVVLIIINLALTVWIIRVMNFTVDGMGKLRIVDQGVRVEGQAQFLNEVYVSNIKSTSGSAVTVESGKNITLRSRNDKAKGDVSSTLFLGNKKVKAFCDKFEVLDKSGDSRLTVDDNQVKIGAKQQLTVNSEAGTVFEKSIQTDHIRGKSTKNLKIESATGKVEMQCSQNMDISAPLGEIKLKSLNSLQLQSNQIRLDSRVIMLRNVKVIGPTLNKTIPGAYQVCVCPSNGRLFLAAPSSQCTATVDVCS